MAFWSGETLKARLPSLVTPFDPKGIDAAAYQLRIGPEIYVSPREGEGPDSRTKVQLKPGEAFTIPAGQFAFLITEETVSVPDDALAFISIRARVKFRGLINISGFHVDPGYSGRLLFSVFNASPAPLHLERGQACFLIWYCSLDRTTTELWSGQGYSGVPVDLINPIAGEVQSLAGLAKKMSETERELSDKVHAVEKEHMYIKAGMALLTAFALGVAVRACSPQPEERRSALPAASAPAAPPPPNVAPAPQPVPPVVVPPPQPSGQPRDVPQRGQSRRPPG
jgi:dCTP deaminase